jgi:hypothetical protein
MTSKLFRSTTWPTALGLVAASTLALGVTFGCSKSEAAPPRGATVAAAKAVTANAKAETEQYVAEIKGAGPYKAGAEGTVEVHVASKGAYHINDKYPFKFKLVDPAPDGVTFPKPILKREDGTFTAADGTFKVPFTVAKAGKQTITGTLSLSVCSDANCVMDKVELAVDVDVK